MARVNTAEVPAVLDGAIRTASAGAASVMANLHVICVLVAAGATPLEAPAVADVQKRQVIVTVTSCESVPSAEMAVKLSVKVAPVIQACTVPLVLSKSYVQLPDVARLNPP